MTSMGPDWVASAGPGAGGIGPLSMTEGRPEAIDLEHAVRLHLEVAGTVAEIDPMDLIVQGPQFGEPDRPSVFVEHASIHRECDLRRIHLGSNVGKGSKRD